MVGPATRRQRPFERDRLHAEQEGNESTRQAFGLTRHGFELAGRLAGSDERSREHAHRQR
jgi:hypothetical protein